MLYNYIEKECNKLKKKYKQGFKCVDKGLHQYFTKHNDSNNKTNKEDTLNNFKALIISINNAQELNPFKNIKYFFISFSPLTCDNII